MPTIKLRERGQMTLPAKIRKRLGLSEGNLILVEEKDGWIILKPLVDPS